MGRQEERASRMDLRPYREADFDAIYALDVLCFAPRFRFSKSLMRRVVGTRHAVVIVACEPDDTGAERLAGFCAASLERSGAFRVGYIATLDVAPASRGRGVGRSLLRAVEGRLAQSDGARVRLHVFTGNLPAIRLYASAGYALAGREPDFYGVGYDALVYEKPLLPLG